MVILQFLSTPFQVGLLLLPDPWCFISHMFGYVIAETWFGIAASVVVELVPSDLTTSALSVYFFIIQIIGGNMPIFVTPITEGLNLQAAMLICFPGFYVAGGILFFIDYLLLRCKQKNSYGMKVGDMNGTIGEGGMVELEKDNQAFQPDKEAEKERDDNNC